MPGERPDRDLLDDAYYALHRWCPAEIRRRLEQIEDKQAREDMRRTLNRIIEWRRYWASLKTKSE